MAEPSDLEKQAQAEALKQMADRQNSGPEKKEEKPKSTLENVVDETTHAIGGLFKAGLAAAVPYGFSSAFPSMSTDTAVLTGAQIASDYTTSVGRGKRYSMGNLLESAVLGTAITPVLETMFRTTNSIPTNSLSGYLTKGAVWGGIMYPAFVGAYLPLAYLIRNRTFKGMGKYFKENYWKTLKQSWTKLLPFSLANIFFAPSWLQIPIAAALSYVFDRFAAPPKEEIPENLKRYKGSYITAFPSVVGKFLYNSLYYTFSGLYDVGKSLGGYAGSAVPSAPNSTRVPPQPRPSPARAQPAPAH